MGTAAPMIFTAAMGAAQYQAQGKIGKYNQSVSERNAQVLEGQATQIEQKAEFDIAQFQKDFKEGIRFAEWLGLEREGLMKNWGFDGSDQYLYARIF